MNGVTVIDHNQVFYASSVVLGDGTVITSTTQFAAGSFSGGAVPNAVFFASDVYINGGNGLIVSSSITASTFNAVGSAYQMNGVTVIDHYRNIFASNVYLDDGTQLYSTNQFVSQGIAISSFGFPGGPDSNGNYTLSALCQYGAFATGGSCDPFDALPGMGLSTSTWNCTFTDAATFSTATVNCIIPPPVVGGVGGGNFNGGDVASSTTFHSIVNMATNTYTVIPFGSTVPVAGLIPPTGAFRFNTTFNSLEIWMYGGWQLVGAITSPQPVAPLGVYADNVDITSVSVHWTPIPTSIGYEVLASTQPDIFSAIVLTTSTSDNSLSVLLSTGLAGNATYYFKVASLWSGATSYAFADAISTLTLPAVVPTGVYVDGVTSSSVVVHWTTIPMSSGYEVLASTNSDFSDPAYSTSTTDNSVSVLTSTGLFRGHLPVGADRSGDAGILGISFHAHPRRAWSVRWADWSE